MNKQVGFTLIEALLSVAILTIITGVSLPVYQTFARQNDLDLSTQSIVSMIRRAEVYARGNNTDNVWGVAIQSGVATLYQGSNFASRNTAYDETYDIPDTVANSGLTDIQFAKLTAAPNTTGSITLTSTTNSTRTITVNAKGMVDF